jgi:hypothetical protein
MIFKVPPAAGSIAQSYFDDKGLRAGSGIFKILLIFGPVVDIP